jgi:hypothetical protein
MDIRAFVYYFRKCYTQVFGPHSEYAHRKVYKNQYVNFFSIKQQPRTNVRVRVLLNSGLLARSQFASGRSCDRPTRSRFPVVCLGPRANAELVPKFHVALRASHAVLLMVTSKFRSRVALSILDQNVTIM